MEPCVNDLLHSSTGPGRSALAVDSVPSGMHIYPCGKKGDIKWLLDQIQLINRV